MKFSFFQTIVSQMHFDDLFNDWDDQTTIQTSAWGYSNTDGLFWELSYSSILGSGGETEDNEKNGKDNGIFPC